MEIASPGFRRGRNDNWIPVDYELKNICKTVFNDILIILMILYIGSITACSDSPRTPADPGLTSGGDGAGNDNGNGGNDGSYSRYGQLYFVSDSNTLWVPLGPVHVTLGNISAENPTSSAMVGECTLLSPIDFGDPGYITFTWLADSSTVTYSFFVSDSLDRWQWIPYAEDDEGLTVAPFSQLGRCMIHCRFKFDLPASSSILLTKIRGYKR